MSIIVGITGFGRIGSLLLQITGVSLALAGQGWVRYGDKGEKDECQCSEPSSLSVNELIISRSVLSTALQVFGG